MIQQHALCNCKNYLMKMETEENEKKPAYGMLSIHTTANGGRQITDDCFRDSVHADGIVVAECILQNSDGASEKHAGDRISAAYTKINRDQKRQVNQFGPAAVFVKESLKDKRQQSDAENRAAVKFVDLDIGVRALSDI